jgi:hypothetical protein
VITHLHDLASCARDARVNGSSGKVTTTGEKIPPLQGVTACGTRVGAMWTQVAGEFPTPGGGFRQFSLFQPSQRGERYRSQLLDFMETHVYPAEAEYETQMRESGNPHHHPR